MASLTPTILLFGESGVGKTALIARFLGKPIGFKHISTRFPKETALPGSFIIREGSTDMETTDVFQGSLAAIVLLYDLSNPSSFASLVRLRELVNYHCFPTPPLLLLGTKNEMQSFQPDLAPYTDLPHKNISAKTSESVEEIRSWIESHLEIRE